MTKICTSIEQSRKLIELGLDTNTADMFWDLLDGDEPDEKVPTCYPWKWDANEGICPAWSLSALLDIIPSKIGDSVNKIIKSELQKKHFCVYSLKLKSIKETYGDTPVDAVFDMVVWLLNNKKI